MSPQTELQEVLGTDEEAGALDGDETASLGGPEEEKEQENIEPPVQAALLTAPVPAAQVGSGISSVPLAMSFVPACPCRTLVEHSLSRNAAVMTLSRALLQQLPRPRLSTRNSVVAAGLKGLSVLPYRPPQPFPGLHRLSRPLCLPLTWPLTSPLSLCLPP